MTIEEFEQVLSKLPFTKSNTEVLSDFTKVSMLFKNDVLLIVTDHGEVDCFGKNTVFFSIFKNKELLISYYGDVHDLVKEFLTYQSKQ